jgi:hypothetical protein
VASEGTEGAAVDVEADDAWAMFDVTVEACADAATSGMWVADVVVFALEGPAAETDGTVTLR